MSYVYFAQARDNDLVKIGFTRDVPARLQALGGVGFGPLTLLGAVPGARELEGHYHRRYSRSRVTGEWFKPSRSILGEARRHACRPEDLAVFNLWDREAKRVSVRLEIDILDALSTLRQHDRRSIHQQINFMLKKCLASGDHLERQIINYGDLFGGLDSEKAA